MKLNGKFNIIENWYTEEIASSIKKDRKFLYENIPQGITLLNFSYWEALIKR
jgi:hypothetical protein